MVCIGTREFISIPWNIGDIFRKYIVLTSPLRPISIVSNYSKFKIPQFLQKLKGKIQIQNASLNLWTHLQVIAI